MARTAIVVLFLCLFASVLQAAEPTRARVTGVVDGDTVILDSGREVRLVGLQAPKLPLGRKNFTPWPLADAAKRALEELALGQTVELAYGGRRVDRHDRLLAHLTVVEPDGGLIWVQGALLAQGMARVYSFADNRWRVAEMLAIERAARAARRGIWDDRFYRVREVGQTEKAIGSFQLVEGRVLAVAEVRGRVYLNFGSDWRSDFTVTLEPAVRRKFEAEGIAPKAYQDRWVRVRGWLKSFNGPMIEVTHPEQIEVLEP